MKGFAPGGLLGGTRKSQLADVMTVAKKWDALLVVAGTSDAVFLGAELLGNVKVVCVCDRGAS